MVNSIDVLFKYLPLRISRAVHSLPSEIFGSVNEIRLRKNAPVSLTVGTKNILFDESGHVCGINSAIYATECELTECISKLTGGSLYTCDEYISQGFIPLAEGGRAGVCGRVAIRSGKMSGFAEIYSVNLRLHRFVPEFATPLITEYRTKGLCGALVCSPPALGKTTFLRSAAYMLSAGKGIAPKRVALADERAELAAGINKAGLLDVISGVHKSEAINLLTRTMAPEVIVCDEIGANEVDTLLEAQNTGVCLIASAHCNTPKDLLKRGRMKKLLESGIFPLCVLLGQNGTFGCEIAETERFL